jgi:hypothetical protein
MGKSSNSRRMRRVSDSLDDSFVSDAFNLGADIMIF